jgi:F0F1-type ATP synthase assembly protein I
MRWWYHRSVANPVLASILRRHVSRTARRGVVACLIVMVLAGLRFAGARTIGGRVTAIAGGAAALVLFVLFVLVARRKQPGLDELVATPGSIVRITAGPGLVRVVLASGAECRFATHGGESRKLVELLREHSPRADVVDHAA